MIVMLDNTMATMGDLIAFDGFLNASVPFVTGEHEVQYRDPQRQYSDFEFGNAYNKTCDYPRFWLETGFPVGVDVTDQLVGCYDSEFDQVCDKILIFQSHADFCRSTEILRAWVTLMGGNALFQRLLAYRIDFENGSHQYDKKLSNSRASQS